jgi:hypothetical protein
MKGHRTVSLAGAAAGFALVELVADVVGFAATRVLRIGSASIASRTASISAKVFSQLTTVTRSGMNQALGRNATKDSWP